MNPYFMSSESVDQNLRWLERTKRSWRSDRRNLTTLSEQVVMCVDWLVGKLFEEDDNAEAFVAWKCRVVYSGLVVKYPEVAKKITEILRDDMGEIIVTECKRDVVNGWVAFCLAANKTVSQSV